MKFIFPSSLEPPALLPHFNCHRSSRSHSANKIWKNKCSWQHEAETRKHWQRRKKAIFFSLSLCSVELSLFLYASTNVASNKFNNNYSFSFFCKHFRYQFRPNSNCSICETETIDRKKPECNRRPWRSFIIRLRVENKVLISIDVNWMGTDPICWMKWAERNHCHNRKEKINNKKKPSNSAVFFYRTRNEKQKKHNRRWHLNEAIYNSFSALFIIIDRWAQRKWTEDRIVNMFCTIFSARCAKQMSQMKKNRASKCEAETIGTKT